MDKFAPQELKNLYTPPMDSNGEDNGQVTIIGGSELFHGAPHLALTVASRVVDMVFFTSPEKSIESIADKIKSKLFSFIWVPWEEIEDYVEKSDACLIGPGFMRFGHESAGDHERKIACDAACQVSRDVTKRLLTKFPEKKWVIDAGSLQVMDAKWIPEGAVLTPNKQEFKSLFDVEFNDFNFGDLVKTVEIKARKHNCTICYKAPVAIVTNGTKTVIVEGGNGGLTKGGTGDTLAGLITALLAKNDSFISTSAGAHILKSAADELYKKVGTNYNADDLANFIPEHMHNLLE